jgi:penicillin-binding protein 2
MYLDNDRRPTLTPQLAVRVALIGGIALVAFAVIFFRLWYLQVLSGDHYLAEARDNRVREIKVQAPRGEIVDRDGRKLVDNRPAMAVVLTPDRLPKDIDARRALYRRLGKLLDLRPRALARDVEPQLSALPYSTVTVKQDVSDQLAWYLLEHRDDFRGADVERVFLRSYPHHEIGAHLFGTVGELNPDQEKDPRYRDVDLGDRVGQSGIELQYDRFLRGRNGASRLQVDALGNLNQRLSKREPVQGRQLRLSVDLDVQEAGQEALAGGTGRGAFAVMDVKTGEVLGLGSEPSYDPNIFSKGIKQRDYARLQDEDNGSPLTNRAIQGGYPTGSTFKLVTATAALESGVITPDTPLFDPGSYTVGDTVFENAGKVAHGTLALRQALTVSSDVFFYQLGDQLNSNGDGLALQHWARRLGIGRNTGIDLPEELPGLLPTPKWRNALFKAGDTDRPWTPGDNVNLSVGQGDLKADPIQMAVAYAAIANPRGRVLRPRLGQRIEDSSGRAIQQLEAPTARRLKINPEYRQAILDGLRGAASAPGGTSTSVFQGFPIQVAGKTGTAEKGLDRPDQSWYVALAPWPTPKYVVAVTDEAGGFGADTAAPMARRILAALFNVHESKLVEGGGPSD